MFFDLLRRLTRAPAVPSDANRSPLALWEPAHRTRRRTMKPWGLCVHTSGRGIVARAQKANRPVIDLALEWYRAKEQSGVHYVIDYDGTIYQMLEDNIRGAHVGISVSERLSYLSGRWRKTARALGVELWRERWPGHRSPQHLYPTRSPNGCYVGVELVPLPSGRVGADGLWFTREQHQAVAELARDLAARHDWPDYWERSPRFLGHEDIDAFARWDLAGGWDPGSMRPRPRFDWVLASGSLYR